MPTKGAADVLAPESPGGVGIDRVSLAAANGSGRHTSRAAAGVDGGDRRHLPAQRFEPGHAFLGALQHAAIEMMHKVVARHPDRQIAASVPEKLCTLNSRHLSPSFRSSIAFSSLARKR